MESLFIVRISLLKWKWDKLIMSELLFQKLFINNHGISIDIDKGQEFHGYWCLYTGRKLWEREDMFPLIQFSSVAQLCLTDSLRPHELQHTRHPCPSPTPRVYPNSCPLSWWCHPTISSSIVPFSSRLQSFPASGSFQMSQLFASGGQNIGVSASVIPMNTRDWSPLGWTGWISLQSKGQSRVFFNTTVQKHQFFGTQLFL